MRVLLLAVLLFLPPALSGQSDKQPNEDLICVMRRGNPLLQLWRLVRQGLEAPTGDAYAEKLKGANLPTFPATVLSITDNELLISIGDGKTPDAILQFTAPWKGKPLQPGAELEFAGKSVELRRQPFRLIVAVDPAKITLTPRAIRDNDTICECSRR